MIPTPDVGPPAVWAALIAVSVFAVLSAPVLRLGARRPTEARLRAFDRRLRVVEGRMNALDGVVSGLPTEATIRDLGQQMKGNQETVEAMAVTLTTLTRGIDRIEDFLLKAASDALMGTRPTRTSDGDDR